MQSLTSWGAALDQGIAHVAFCLSEPMSAPVCGPFWSWSIVGGFTLCALTVVYLVWQRIWYDMRDHAAARLHQELDRMPAEELTNDLRWIGDEVPGRELAGGDLEYHVRAARNIA